MTPDEVDFIAKELANMREDIRSTRDTALLLVSEVSALKALIHAPGECDLKETVAASKTWQDKTTGKFAIIGIIAMATTSVIGGLIVKFLK